MKEKFVLMTKWLGWNGMDDLDGMIIRSFGERRKSHASEGRE